MTRTRFSAPTFLPAVVSLGAPCFLAVLFFAMRYLGLDASYGTGAFAGALAMFALAFALRSQVSLAAALVLALLWSGVQTLDRESNPHVWFPVLWAPMLVCGFRFQWSGALRLAWASLLLWSVMLFVPATFVGRPWFAGERTALLQVYLFAWIALYIVGRGMWWYPYWKRFHAPVVTTGAVGAVAALFALTFPAVQHVGLGGELDDEVVAPVSAIWIVVTLAALVVVALLMLWRYRGTRLSTLPLYRQGAFIWLIVAGAVALANVGLAGRFGVAVATAYNLLSLCGVIWLVMTGIDRRERRLVNLGALFLVVLALARYRDAVLMVFPEIVFYAAGVALAAGLAWGERLRRRLIRSIPRARGAP